MTPTPTTFPRALAPALLLCALLGGASAQVRYIISPDNPGVPLFDVRNEAINFGGTPYQEVDQTAVGGKLVAALFPDDGAADDLRAARPDLIVERDLQLEPATGGGPPPWSLDRIDQRPNPPDGIYGPPMIQPCGEHRPYLYLCDTGVQVGHPEFVAAGDRVRFVGSYVPAMLPRAIPAFMDPYDHGTAVAGCAVGETTGAGRCPADIVSAVCYPDPGGLPGGGTLVSYAADVIYWSLNEHTIRAADDDPLNDASVLVFASTTLGGTSLVLDIAVQRARMAGMVVVVAAGNQGVDAMFHSPAGAAAPPYGDITLTVAASDATDTRWIGGVAASNYGPTVELFAPGAGVLAASTVGPPACVARSGTSLSTGYVAGAAARILHENPRARAARVEGFLLDQADPVYGPSGPFPGMPPGPGGINAVPKLLYINPSSVPCVPLPFDAWCAEQGLDLGGAGAGAGGGGAGDPMLDCGTLLLEYLMGLPPGAAGGEWPEVRVSAGHLEFRFPLADYVCPPVSFEVQMSADCDQWTALPPEAIIEDASAPCIEGARTMLVRIPLGPPEIFLRLHVVNP